MLAVSILASFVAFLDGSIVNVALPTIQRELGGGLSAQQWIVDAYLLALGSLILIAGSLSDLFGRKKILMLGLLGFGAASLLCAVAPTSGWLIVFRGMQGVAGALLVPSSLALIIANFTGSAEGKAIGTWTAWTGISFIIGPLVGGALVDAASWRWIFAINVLPITITLYLLSKLRTIKDERAQTRVDFVGAVLCALGLGGPVFALIEQPRYGWGSPLIYLSLISGLLIFGAFLIYENRASRPMLPLYLFKNRNFSVGNVATFAIYAGLSAGTFLITVFLQQAAGYSALRAGLALLPVTLIMFSLSSRFGALSGRYGPRLFMGIGPLVAGTGFLMMLALGARIDYWHELFWPIVVFGVGLSITVAPLTAAILGDVPREQAGIASAVNNAVSRVAGLVAIAMVGAILSAQFGSTLHRLNKDQIYPKSYIEKLQQTPLQAEHSDGCVDYTQCLGTKAAVAAFHAGTATIAGLVIVGGVISLVGIQNPARKR